MMMPQDWERVAAEQARSWEAERVHRQLLSEIPHQPPRWQRWTGDIMMRIGTWLMNWGKQMAQHEYGKARPTSLPVN